MAEARLTAELTNVLVSIRRRRVGAEGEGSKSSIDDFRFCGCQFTRTLANQYSVLVIHVFSPFIIRTRFEWAQAL